MWIETGENYVTKWEQREQPSVMPLDGIHWWVFHGISLSEMGFGWGVNKVCKGLSGVEMGLSNIMKSLLPFHFPRKSKP